MKDKRSLSPERILDDFSRELQYVHPPDAHKKYAEARTKAIAQLVKIDNQRLNRPDREKIGIEILVPFYRRMDDIEEDIKDEVLTNSMKRARWKVITEETADQISALFDEEEIRKDERERIILELEEEGLLNHEIKSYGASGRECEEICAACRLLESLKEVGK